MPHYHIAFLNHQKTSLAATEHQLAASSYSFVQVRTLADPATLFPAGSKDIGGVGAPVFAAGRWAAISGRRSYSVSGNIVATALRKTSHF